MKKLKKIRLLNHLWIKNYIVVFLTVSMLTGVLHTVWQHTMIEYIFEEQKNSIKENQMDIINMLINAITSAKLREGVDVLSSKQVKEAAEEVFYDNSGQMALFCGDKLISSNYFQIDSMDKLLSEQNIDPNKCIFRYYESGDIPCIKAASVVTLNGKDYKIITTTDISGIYNYGKDSQKRTLIFCISETMFTALFFLIFFYGVMRPLKKINERARAAAAGNYNEYLSLKSGDEFAMIADSINQIAQTAKENEKSLKAAADSQKQFITHLSHEMSTPLTSILCYSEMMLQLEQFSIEKIKNYAEIILFEGRRLKTLSEKFTDFLYIGKINEHDKVEVSIKEIINDVYDTMSPVFEKKRVYFVKQVHDFMINVELELFKTMLYNYLDNAVNASSEEDVVEISAYQTQLENIIEISDYNVGMNQKECEKIDASPTVQKKVMGLGMVLCREIAAAHKGEVTILSGLNNGTTVQIKFQQNQE